jgi:hypothetical protein
MPKLTRDDSSTSAAYIWLAMLYVHMALDISRPAFRKLYLIREIDDNLEVCKVGTFESANATLFLVALFLRIRKPNSLPHSLSANAGSSGVQSLFWWLHSHSTSMGGCLAYECPVRCAAKQLAPGTCRGWF